MAKTASKEVDRSDWRKLFELASLGYRDEDVTIEILGDDLGDQLEAERLPLFAITYDDKDDAVVISVGGKDRRYPVVLRHIIHHPQKILADDLPPEIPWVFEIVDPDGVQALVTVYKRGAA
jgi:hypothetical protein